MKGWTVIAQKVKVYKIKPYPSDNRQVVAYSKFSRVDVTHKMA